MAAGKKLSELTIIAGMPRNARPAVYNPDGSTSTSKTATAVYGVDTLAALGAIPMSGIAQRRYIRTAGAAALGDGFGGDWEFDPAATANENVEGRCVRPADIASGAPGRWLKRTGPWLGLHLREWGAPADGSDGADDHWRAMLAWNVQRGGGLCEIADGEYVLRDPQPIEDANVLHACIDVPSNTRLHIHESAQWGGDKSIGARGDATHSFDVGYAGLHIRSVKDVTIEGHGWFDGGDGATEGGLGTPILVRYRQDGDHPVATNIDLDGLRFRNCRSSPVQVQWRPSKIVLTGVSGTPPADDAFTASQSGGSGRVSAWIAGTSTLYYTRTSEEELGVGDVLTGTGWSATIASINSAAYPTVDGMRWADMWAEDLGSQGFGEAGVVRGTYAGLTAINTGLAVPTLSIGCDLSIASADSTAQGLAVFDTPGGGVKVEARYDATANLKSKRVALSDALAVSDTIKATYTTAGTSDYTLTWTGLIESSSIISVVRERNNARAYLNPATFWSATGFGNPAGGTLTLNGFMTFTGAPSGGTPTVGDVISNGSGATGVVMYWDGTTASVKVTSGATLFANGNTVSGGGGWSATISTWTAPAASGDIYYISRSRGTYAFRNTGHRVNMTGLVGVGIHGIGLSEIVDATQADAPTAFRFSEGFIADVLPNANGAGNAFWVQSNALARLSITFTGAPSGGTPAANDSVTNGAGTPATGTVVSWDGTTLVLALTSVNTARFAVGDTVTNGTWSATVATLTSGRLSQKGVSVHDFTFFNTSGPGTARASGVSNSQCAYVSCLGGTFVVPNNLSGSASDGDTYDDIDYSRNRHFDCPIGATFYDLSSSGVTNNTNGSRRTTANFNFFLGNLIARAIATYGGRGGTRIGNIAESTGTAIIMTHNGGTGVRHAQTWLKSGGVANALSFISGADYFAYDSWYGENGTNPIAVVATVTYGWVGRGIAKNAAAKPTVDAKVETDWLWFGSVSWTPGLLANIGDVASTTGTISGAPATAVCVAQKPPGGSNPQDCVVNAEMSSAGNVKLFATAKVASRTPPPGTYLVAARQMALAA